MKFMMKWRLN